MEKSILMQRDLDDILFEYRNRAYGAYALRKSYGNHIRKASIVGMAVFILFIISPVIADRLKNDKSAFNNTNVELMPPPVAKKKEEIIVPPPPPKKELPKPIATQAFTPPKITNREDIIEPDIPKMEDIKVAVSTVTQAGENVDLPPLAEVAPPPEPAEPKKEEPEDNEVRLPFGVQQQPEFKDGQAAMYKFLRQNIVYPAVARENGIEGTVYVGFIIGKDGSIRDVQVKRGIGGGCNEEAVRVIRLMPNWNPGKQNGKAVAVAFTMPVKFELD